MTDASIAGCRKRPTKWLLPNVATGKKPVKAKRSSVRKRPLATRRKMTSRSRRGRSGSWKREFLGARGQAFTWTVLVTLRDPGRGDLIARKQLPTGQPLWPR